MLVQDCGVSVQICASELIQVPVQSTSQRAGLLENEVSCGEGDAGVNIQLLLELKGVAVWRCSGSSTGMLVMKTLF